MAFWSYIFVTAANPKQADAFSERLIHKKKDGFIDSRTQCIVLDDASCTGGSGGAVMYAIDRLFREEKCTGLPNDLRILLINCGGESRRVPQYSVCGKLFAPCVCQNGRDIFDDLYETLSVLLEKMDSGFVVSTSDIVISLSPDIDRLELNTAFAVEDNVQRGTQHGVFVTNPDRSVKRFLHKRSAEELNRLSAVHADGKVDVDTGLLYFTADFVNRMYQMIREYDADAHPNAFFGELRQTKLHLYEDIVSVMNEESTPAEYLSAADPAALHIRELLFCRLKKERLSVVTLQNSTFCHIGITHELLRLHQSSNHSYTERNCIIDPSAVIGHGCYLENSIIGANTVIGDNCIVSYAHAENVTISPNTVLYCMKTKNNQFVACNYSVSENCHTKPEQWTKQRFPAAPSCVNAVKLLTVGLTGSYSLQTLLENADYSFPFQFEQRIRSSLLRKKYEDFRQQILCAGLQDIHPNQPFRFIKDQSTILLPARVNLAGTWTDAAPYCILFGGAILNIALRIQNDLPIQASARVIPENAFVLRCDDKYLCASFRGLEQLTDLTDEDDPFLIHKAALMVCGIISGSADSADENTPQSFCNGGLELSICAKNIPRGSGLGTSSILLCALICAIYEITGRELHSQQIIQKVFLAEQLMHCGGGWQDQVGGLFPGIKCAHTEKGLTQSVVVETVRPGKAIRSLLQKRCCLIYTGERYFGRLILREIMARCLDGSKSELSAMHDMKALVSRMKYSIENDDVDSFADLLNEHNKLLRKLSDNIFTQRMYAISDAVSDLIAGYTVCGAGGGGFLFAILSEKTDIRVLKKRLSVRFNNGVRVMNCSVCYDESDAFTTSNKDAQR